MPDEDAPGGARATTATAPLPPSAQAAMEAEPLAPPERPPYDVVPPDDLVGLRAVRVMLADLPFPATLRQLVERVGAWRVPITGVHFHPMRQFLEGMPNRKYRSPRAVLRAMARAHPDLRP